MTKKTKKTRPNFPPRFSTRGVQITGMGNLFMLDPLPAVPIAVYPGYAGPATMTTMSRMPPGELDQKKTQ